MEARTNAVQPKLAAIDEIDAISYLSLNESNPNRDTLISLFSELKQRGIQVQETDGRTPPPEAFMHDRAAVIPMAIVSPMSEWGVQETLKLLTKYQLYNKLSVSVKSGGHGYFNGASCPGIMINLGSMTKRHVEGDTLVLEPGCILGQVIDTLARHKKAVPHGDCFGVGTGGHFLTAGWDLILARRYGLGCQSVIGGRVILWDGSAIEVDGKHHPELLYAMRGGAAAGVGVVTELRLRLIDEPLSTTWRFTSLTKSHLETLVACKIFTNASLLPKDISMSFRLHFEAGQVEPVCSFNVVSLLSPEETVRHLRQCFGDDVMSMIGDLSTWNEKPLIDLRMLPASDFLAKNPGMLAELSPLALHQSPEDYWKRSTSLREMARSFFTSISHWVIPECETILLDLFVAFQSVQEETLRERVYALIIQGGGRITELQDKCSMPLGQALARFEVHWDFVQEEESCRQFTNKISDIMKSKEDRGPCRPYRGDIWLEEQAEDANLDSIKKKYDRRLGS